MYYAETVECQNLISWPEGHVEGALPQCRTGARLEGNNKQGPLETHSDVSHAEIGSPESVILPVG